MPPRPPELDQTLRDVFGLDEFRPGQREVIQDVLAGKLPVIIHADDVRQMTAAVAFAQQEKLKLILAGGYDARQCLPLLKKYDVPIIIGTEVNIYARKLWRHILTERLLMAGTDRVVGSL